MRTTAVINYYGSRGGVRGLANALGISVQGIYQWGEWVPESSARRLEKITQGALRIDPSAPYALPCDQ